MIFRELGIPGAFVIEPKRLEDERGFFARTFCEQEFAQRGLCTRFVQCSISYNRLKGTLRGLHYQAAPHEEIKLVRCTMGAIYDVIVDLRPASPTKGKWTATELTAENRRTLYIPAGVAHGFQTLMDDAEVFYQISDVYHPQSARGVRWNDPGIGIDWASEPTVVSEKDQGLPCLSS